MVNRFARAFVALLLLVLVSTPALARRIDAGEAVTLAPDEGLLVVSISSNGVINKASISRDGSAVSGIVLPQLPAGRTLQLHAVKAGEYAWHEVTLYSLYGGVRYPLVKNPEYRFRVEAGKLNYPGELQVNGRSIYQVRFHRANRSLPVIDWLDASHAAIAKTYPLQYTGHFPDPFPAFYRAEKATAAMPSDPNAGAAPPPSGTLPLDPKVLWGRNRVTAVALSPNGELLAEATYRGEDTWRLELIDLKAGEGQVIATLPLEYDTLEWKDDSTLITTASLGTIARTSLHVIGPGPGKRAVRSGDFPRGGRLVDLLPREPGRVLFERVDSTGRLMVHRVDVSSPDALPRMQHLKSKDRLNTALTGDVSWYADGEGELRAAIVRRDDTYVLVHGRGTTFNDVYSLEDEGDFQPVSLSHDGEMLYGLSDEDRPQRDVVAFDMRTRAITRTVFSKPGVDIASVIVNERRDPVGVRYYESGRLVTEYFDAADRAQATKLAAAFPGSTVSVMDRSRDGRQLLLWVDRIDRPPQLFHYDGSLSTASLLDEVMPALADTRFAPTHVLKVKSADGLPIDAFLTLPPGTGPAPLVVMPHGGPIGVADSVHFDREVQFIASLGYAVLRVNFRGSDGYGRAFREAGRRSLGTRIEDDIDAALAAALAAHPLDAKRMCVLGSSYGGYSAMVSTLRWPDRFRCAVSMHGVTDRALLFTASDSASSDRLRTELVKMMGDPKTDMEGMLATSPLYRYRDLRTPLLLLHGRDDIRVDFEHTRRLVRMLNLVGRTPVVMAFQDAGHGLHDVGDLDTAWRGIAGFLRTHLGVGRGGTVQAPPPTPASSAPAVETPQHPAAAAR